MFPLEKIGVNANIKVIGVTGAVNSGKSTLLSTLETMGVSTLSVDTIIHNLYTSNKELINKITSLLGEDALTNHMLNKELIAKKVFNNKELLYKLEKLTTPFVIDSIKQAAKTAKKALAVEVPLLFELSLENLFDLTLFVKTDPKICKQRSSLTFFEERNSRLLPNALKEKMATITITNNGNLADFKTSIIQTMEGIIA
jgi:dephospho-CoA kinase